ncbi:cytidylyltransferase domain-containing protein [Oceanobacillus senegalensis]|uniref:acylneuraminate cytidylyltransferase family protein n=1 Tax=Oceanobacillus senegalensis TaxID=1936063 RepID=UPI000A30B1D3|nr:acylneuraminate cytidylyltransferase family protein [Oceanobacillus senegalensis]
MLNKKKFLAIIPARSGSKGLKDKNIKNLNGKPMIAYTIEAATQSRIFDDIVVSTDSEKYAQISIEHGATVPFLRPTELASDSSNSIDTIIHTINELKKRNLSYDYFVLLQPTSPLRDANDIKKAVNLLIEKKALSVVSVCKTKHSPLIMNTLNESLDMSHFISDEFNKRRQELPAYYRVNGAIYLSELEHFLQHKSFYKKGSFAYVMDQKNSIDIDSALDFELVKILMKYK